MEQQELIQKFNEYLTSNDEDQINSIWQKQSQIFQSFWENVILNNTMKELRDVDIDPIIQILDRNAKGNTKGCEAIAKVMIAQGVWRKMFKGIKGDKKLQDIINKTLTESNDSKVIAFINELYKYNEGKRNSLTGKSGNALNALLGAFNPKKYCHIVSVSERKKIFEHFKISGGPDFDNDPIGTIIVQSNIALFDYFRQLGIKSSLRLISKFFYAPNIKDLWRMDSYEDYGWGGRRGEARLAEENETTLALFYMESQLEDFLIENWELTELGKKYDLVEEAGEIVSQQYPTKIGKIDILAQDKDSKQYVVIELKKDQTSDDTIGQLARYMGWLEEHKTNGALTKGIIIASQYDDRLYYALKKFKDIDIYLYRVNFNLTAFEKNNEGQPLIQ